MICLLGFHDWREYDAVYGSKYNKRHGIYKKAERRKCCHCGKTQVKKPVMKNGKKTFRWISYKL